MKRKSKTNLRRILMIFSALVVTTVFLNFSVQASSALTMYTPTTGDPIPGCLYARAMQLNNSGTYNGRMYATFEQYVTGIPSFPIFESKDNGASWAKISSVTDQKNGWGMRYQPFLYELPQAIGDMPAGTILCVGNSIPSDLSKTKLDLYKSTDHAKTWTFVSSVATGGVANPNGKNDPVWEPFLLVANNKLICYYSDERDPAYNQKIVHETSTNGINWSNTVDDVALSTQNLRPGMPVVARLSNGQYIRTYEVINASGTPTSFKISSNPESWTSSNQGTTISSGGSPYVTVMPNGKVVVTNSNSSGNLYVNSSNATGSWITISSPLGKGYSRCLLPLSSSNLFIISGGNLNVNNTVKYASMPTP